MGWGSGTLNNIPKIPVHNVIRCFPHTHTHVDTQANTQTSITHARTLLPGEREGGKNSRWVLETRPLVCVIYLFCATSPFPRSAEELLFGRKQSSGCESLVPSKKKEGTAFKHGYASHRQIFTADE